MANKNDYLARVAECDRLARQAPNPTVRMEWEQMGAWFRLMGDHGDKSPPIWGVRPTHLAEPKPRGLSVAPQSVAGSGPGSVLREDTQREVR
jgi:hypothetical protein